MNGHISQEDFYKKVDIASLQSIATRHFGSLQAAVDEGIVPGGGAALCQTGEHWEGGGWVSKRWKP